MCVRAYNVCECGVFALQKSYRMILLIKKGNYNIKNSKIQILIILYNLQHKTYINKRI